MSSKSTELVPGQDSKLKRNPFLGVGVRMVIQSDLESVAYAGLEFKIFPPQFIKIGLQAYTISLVEFTL